MLGGVEETQSTTIALNQFDPHVFLWRDDQGSVSIENPFQHRDEQLKESLGLYGSRSIVRNGKKCEN